ncbi:response regulator, partial [Marinospirillum sp.]|uniref:response regulator n=1 Tax=Marinospirillum sp. TaxID=2183934 RepID=UPI003A85616D
MTDSDLVYSVLVITQQPNPDYLRALTPHFALRTGDWSQVGMLLKQETADLLIIDQVLEDAQLGDLLTSLPHHPAFGRIPTLLLTQAQPDEALYLRCTFLGIDDVLHKPVLPSHLLLKARSLAERVCLGRQLNQQSQYLERLVEHSHREAEMASYLFYNNLLDQVSDHLLGFNR